MKALAKMVQINVSYAAAYQNHVIDSLDALDETLQREVLFVLCEITNTKNVTIIIDKLLQTFRVSKDTHFRVELAERVLKLAERFTPSDEWFIDVITQTLLIAGSLVSSDVLHRVIQVFRGK